MLKDGYQLRSQKKYVENERKLPGHLVAGVKKLV
jgi:hypothetical protein